MAGQFLTVADAVSSRYRGKISCVSDEEVIELVADISDLEYPFFVQGSNDCPNKCAVTRVYLWR